MTTSAAPAPLPAPSPGTPPSTRPASLWPDDSAQAHGREGSTHPAASAFGLRGDRAPRAPRRLTSALLCRPALALRVLLVTQAATALVAAVAAGSARAWSLQMPALAAATLFATLAWLVVLCPLARRSVLDAPPQLAERVLARRLAGRATALGALAAFAGWLLWGALSGAPAQLGALWQGAASALVGAAAGAALWSWVDQRVALAKPAEATARLAELQSRIRPHFLFNALNTALALVQVEPDKAETVLEDLASLFRAALSHEAQAVTLDEEVDLAQRYLAIERLRFAHRLEVRWDLDPDAAFARVPPLVLQPLVENAVRHGIEPAEGGGCIWVRTAARQGMAEIEVVNTLPEEPGEAGSGIAQANVRDRLKLMHDLAASFDTSTHDGRYHARIVVPL